MVFGIEVSFAWNHELKDKSVIHHPFLHTGAPVTSTLIGCFRSNQPEDVCCSSLWRNRGEDISLLACLFMSLHLSACQCLSSVLPPAGGQRHRVERDALVGRSPHGGRLGHRAGLQSGGRGAEGNAHRKGLDSFLKIRVTCPSPWVCFCSRTALQWCVHQVTMLRNPLPCQYSHKSIVTRILVELRLTSVLTNSLCHFFCVSYVCVWTGGFASLTP